MPRGLPRPQRRSSLASAGARGVKRACSARSALYSRGPRQPAKHCLCMRDGKNCQSQFPLVEMLVSLRAASLARLRVDA